MALPRRIPARSKSLGSPAQPALAAVAKHDAVELRRLRAEEREARRRRGGRPRKPAAHRGMSHASRPHLANRFPVHVTLRLVPGLPSLRARKSWRVARKVLLAAARRFGQMFRIVEFSVQTNHVHLLVEAENRRELSRGMQGLGIRLAKNLNLALARKGAVLEDRYHAHILASRAATASALRYVRQNRDLRRLREGRWASWNEDPCSSAEPALRRALPTCRSWLLSGALAAFDARAG